MHRRIPTPALARRRLLLAAAAAGAAATPGARAEPAPPASLELAEMTWPALQAAIRAGWQRVILPSGGVEQNGPHMILGKHDHIVRHAAQRIAARLGRTLVAPVLSYVPQGRWTPPEGNFRFPGTLGVTEAAFEGVLDGAARSLRQAGFTAICLIADHGGSQAPQARVAARLDAAWRRDGVRVLAIGSYYAAMAAQEAWLRGQGETAASIGSHAGLPDTAELMATHPAGVDLARLEGRQGAALEALGGSGDPSRATAERGEAILGLRIAAAVAEIEAALAPR